MNKIYDVDKVKIYMEKSIYCSLLEELNINLFLIEYEKGEFVSSPFQEESLFQIVVKGSICIYFVRTDGTRYALSRGYKDYILGEMEVFSPRNNNVYTEADENVICISFSIEKNRDTLLSNNAFLQLICSSLCNKMGNVTNFEAEPTSLSERVFAYMKYKCTDGILNGMEQTAFNLHCSSRQLQRIMNKFQEQGKAEKIAKGTYKLK